MCFFTIFIRGILSSSFFKKKNAVLPKILHLIGFTISRTAYLLITHISEKYHLTELIVRFFSLNQVSDVGTHNQFNLASFFCFKSIVLYRRVYTTEQKWHGPDKNWNGSNSFYKETVNFYPFRDGSIGAYGPVAERIKVVGRMPFLLCRINAP